MRGFEFGSDEDVQRKLIEVLESREYVRAVAYWERKRGRNFGNFAGGFGANGGGGVGGVNGAGAKSNSSLAISFTSDGGTTYGDGEFTSILIQLG